MKPDNRTARPHPGSRSSSVYLYSWIAVAACGMAYVGIAATRPDIIATVLPLAEPSSEQAFGGRAAADMADELATLRKWVHEMHHELASTKSALQEQVQTNSALMQRITSAEDRLPPVREVRAEPPGKAAAVLRGRAAVQPGAGGTTPASQAAAAQGSGVTSGAPAQGASVEAGGFRVINSPAGAAAPSAPITTGSINAAPGAAPAGTALPKTGAAPPRPRGIEIGSADSLEVLRSKWGDIAGRNSEALGDAGPRYRLATDGRAAPFTLVAGPFGTTEDAIRTCSQLRSKGVTCRVSDFSGSAF